MESTGCLRGMHAASGGFYDTVVGTFLTSQHNFHPKSSSALRANIEKMLASCGIAQAVLPSSSVLQKPRVPQAAAPCLPRLVPSRTSKSAGLFTSQNVKQSTPVGKPLSFPLSLSSEASWLVIGLVCKCLWFMSGADWTDWIRVCSCLPGGYKTRSCLLGSPRCLPEDR